MEEKNPKKEQNSSTKMDLTGRTFGRWTVLSEAEPRENECYWYCECSCEKHTRREVSQSNLISDKSKSCGCLRKGRKSSAMMDLTGQTFGRWNVLSEAEPRGYAHYWLCECSCENHTRREVLQATLVSGRSKSCGCLGKGRKSSTMMDLTGKTFGRWTVLSEAEPREYNYYWLCECSCEKHTRREVLQATLVSGTSKSCGCLKNKKRPETTTLHSRIPTEYSGIDYDQEEQLYYANFFHNGEFFYGGAHEKLEDAVEAKKRVLGEKK